MNDPLETHLTADALDAIHAGNPAPRVLLHLETCAACREVVALDARVLAMLGSLPQLDPAPLFADRVLARLDRSNVPAVASAEHHTSREVSARRRVLVGGLLGGGLVTAGFAWAIIEPGTALGLVEPAFRGMTGAAWTSIQALGANAAEQPWFRPIVDAVATPGRALPMLLGAAALYAAGLTAMRRLLTRPAADAGW